MNPDHKNQTLTKTADTGKSVHLSASAGSGKTRALKDRYLALLDVLDNRGLNIDQSVAITFTDKAAAEIKERVMHDLPETMLKKIIRGRQDLRISTIHSFCMNLLKRYPLEAGLPPDFGVLDARDQASKMQKAIEDSLEESDRDPEIMAPLRGFTADDLIGAVGFLLSIRSRLKRMEIDAGGPEGLLRAVRSGMGTEEAGSELTALISSAEWRASLQQMELMLRPRGDLYDGNRGREHLLLARAEDADAALKITGSLAPIYFTNEGKPRKNPSIAKKSSTGKNRAGYEKAFFDIQEMLGRFRALHARFSTGREAVSLLGLFHRAEEHYQESKLREGLLDFDDLEIYAYRLLQGAESPDILYWLDRKILHFLVDEFQDTSDIQWAILNKLTEEIFAGRGADKRMLPTLFVVGDEKQSIYRFREANYRLIENVRVKMERNIPPESREILTLHRNFRSTPEIIETVNQVFSGLWEGSYQPSEADRTRHKGSVRLMELLLRGPGEGTTAPAEAAVLAQEIKKVVEQRSVIYEKDGSDWKTRSAGFGDCAALIQSRTKLKEYEAALQAEGIPYRVVGGIGFYEEEEVQAVMNVLFFLWNRDDRLSLAAALKSPLFGLTDKDIFDLTQDGGNMVDALRQQRPAAWELLNGWRKNAGLAPLAKLIHLIINDTGASVRFGRRNPQAIFNLDKLLDTAREFDRRGYTTLQDFVEWVKNIRETEQREATADMNLPGFQGAVSIMTVHKAKGLEFPVVFLPGMNAQPKSLTTGPRAIIEDIGGAARMAIKDAASPVYDEMWEREHAELLREHQRLLYVAMTRARDHLIMIGSLAAGKTPAKQNSWLSFIHDTSPQPLFQNARETAPMIMAYGYPESPPATAPPPSPGSMQPLSAGRVDRAVDVSAVKQNLLPVPAALSLEWKRATDFIDRSGERGPEQFQGPDGLSISPLSRGTVLHRCLEGFTTSGQYDLERIMRELPEIDRAERAEKEAFIAGAKAVLRSVTGNRDLAWIFERQPGAYSELPFLYKRGNDLVSGIIDRVVVKGNKGSVIDYKAILIENDGALASWKDHYRPQIRIYCEAVKEIFKLPSVEGYLLFLDSNRLEPVIGA